MSKTCENMVINFSEFSLYFHHKSLKIKKPKKQKPKLKQQKAELLRYLLANRLLLTLSDAGSHWLRSLK